MAESVRTIIEGIALIAYLVAGTLLALRGATWLDTNYQDHIPVAIMALAGLVILLSFVEFKRETKREKNV